MIFHTKILDSLDQAGLHAQPIWTCENPDGQKVVWEYDLMSPQNERCGALILRCGPRRWRAFVEMDGDRLKAELARIAGLDHPEPPQDAAEHLARERLTTGFREATQDAAARTRERLATVVEEAAQDVLRNAKRGPDANEAAEAWLREADPCPFDPAQRAWILRRIDRAVEAARLGAGADSVADVVWPEGGGEIEF